MIAGTCIPVVYICDVCARTDVAAPSLTATHLRLPLRVAGTPVSWAQLPVIMKRAVSMPEKYEAIEPCSPHRADAAQQAPGAPSQEADGLPNRTH